MLRLGLVGDDPEERLLILGVAHCPPTQSVHKLPKASAASPAMVTADLILTRTSTSSADATWRDQEEISGCEPVRGFPPAHNLLEAAFEFY